MVDTSMILSLTTPEVIEIKRKILQDRKYNVPVFFYSYIDDDFIINTLILDDRSNDRDTFIKDYQKNNGFHSYKNLIVTLLERDLLEDLHLFNPILITKYCKRSLHIFTLDNIVDIMYGWYIHEKEIPFSIVYLYILKSCGKLWFLSTTTSLRILKENLSRLKESDGYNCMMTEILYQLYSNIPKLNREFDDSMIRDDELGLNISKYYEMDGSKFVHVMKQHPFAHNIYSTIYYLKMSNNVEKLSDKIAESNSKILDRFSMPLYEKTVIESLSKNANNLHLVTWGYKIDEEKLSYITEAILNSEVPLKDFNDYLHVYSVVKKDSWECNIPFNRDFLTRFIVSGTDVNTMLNHIDLRECWFEVLRYGSDESIRELVRNEYKCRYSTSPDETIGEFVINNTDWFQHPMLSDKIMRFICEDINIFNKLDLHMRNSILKATKIDWLLSEFPNLLLSDYVRTFVGNSTVDIRKLCKTVPKSLSYLTSDYISPSTIQYVAKTRGYVELPFVRLTVENVLNMIDDDCGYGYILDLPTFVQMNFVVINILNRILEH